MYKGSEMSYQKVNKMKIGQEFLGEINRGKVSRLNELASLSENDNISSVHSFF